MDKKTKRLGNRATKRERVQAHQDKMEMKRAINAVNTQYSGTRDYTLANLSRNHPRYGDTPAQDSTRKIALDSESEV